MPRRITGKSRLRAAAFILLTAATLAARGAESDDLELFSKDLGISLWDESFSVRTGLGYKDNVLLDETQTKASPFFINGVDVTIFRLPIDGWEYDFLVSGDDIRYWRDIGVGSEDLWLAVARIKRNFGNGWEAGLTGSYAYEAEVLDLLSSEGLTTFAPAKVIGNTLTLRPFVRRNLGTNYWVELQLEGTRQFFGPPAFSYWRAGPRIIFGRNYGNHSEVSLSYSVVDQPFDNEAQSALDGSDLAGTRLVYLTQKAELTWRHYWDKQRLWENTAKLSFDNNRDNGTGFFNYNRYGLSEQFDYNGKSWKITASAVLQHYDYPLQTSTADSTELYQTGLTLNLHVEKSLIRGLALFMEYEYEHAFSNESTEHYIVNSIKGGTLWEF